MFVLKSLIEVPDVIVLLEANPKHFTKPLSISEFQIDGYQVLTSGFASQSCRGIVAYYKEELHISEVTLCTPFKEALCIKLALTNKTMNLLSVYRSPNSSGANNDLLIQLLEEFILLRGEHVIIGDFNFPDINWNTFSCNGSAEKIENKFLNFLNDSFLLQHVDEPTRRAANQTSSVLDLVITSGDIQYYSPLGNGDHSILGFKLVGFTKNLRPDEKRFCYELGDYGGLSMALDECLSNTDRPLESSVDSEWRFFRNTLNELTSRFVPKKQIYKKFTFRMTPELKCLIELKHQLWRRIYKYGDDIMTEFRVTRDKVKR